MDKCLECDQHGTWHVFRSDSVEQLLLVTVMADGVLGLVVRLEAQGLVQLQGLDVEAEIKRSCLMCYIWITSPC